MFSWLWQPPSPRELSQSSHASPKERGESPSNFFGSLSSWERGEGLTSLHRAGEGGSFAVHDIFFIPATSEFGFNRFRRYSSTRILPEVTSEGAEEATHYDLRRGCVEVSPGGRNFENKQPLKKGLTEKRYVSIVYDVPFKHGCVKQSLTQHSQKGGRGNS